MRITHALAALAPFAVFIACSSGGPGSPSLPDPPGGFGQAGSSTPVFGPGAPTSQDNGGQDSGRPGVDTGTRADTRTSTPDTSPTLYDNYDACVAAFAKINSLPCVSEPISSASCTHTKITCNMTSYFECVGSAYVCNEGTLDGTAATSCKSTCG
jgi:hypothetical protein